MTYQDKTKKELINVLQKLQEEHNSLKASYQKVIAERKQTKEELRKTNNYLEILINYANAPIIVWNPELVITRVNHAFEHLSAYNVDEVIGKRLDFLFPGSSARESLVKIEQSSAGVHWESVEIPILRKDGEVRTTLWNSAALYAKDGKTLIATIAQGQDITERKKMDVEFKNSEIRYYDLFENSSEFLFTSDLKGNFTNVNKAAEALTGYTKSELLKMNFKDYTPKKDHRTLFLALYNVYKTGKPLQNLPVEAIIKDKSIKYFETSFTLLRKGEQIIGFNGSSKDITERKKAEENLKTALIKATESDRLKSVFLATMSHELRTPLNAIIGFSDIIDENLPVEEIIGYNKIINVSGYQLLDIVENIFDITLIESGRTRINKREEKLNPIMEFIQVVIGDEQQLTNKNNLDLKLTIPPGGGDPIINTDPEKLKQILINLLKNALKFTHEGHVHYGYKIEKDQTRSEIIFYVEDTGIGIPENKKDFIFDIFRQVEDSFGRIYGGTGIGLSIAKKLTELLGGNIWVESEEGEGSVFYFTIPYEGHEIDDQADETEVEVVPVKKGWLNKKTVLIVEDVEKSFEFLKIVLEKSGINTLWAKNGIEAIKYCSENPDIDLVLMDIRLPEMNGYEATRGIKKFKPNLPIIAQTAHAIAGDRENAIEAGCDDYISKPINNEVLLEKIEKHFSK